MEFVGEEEIELSLGLAIGGGGCRKRARTEDRVSEAPGVEEEVDLVKRKKEMQALRRSEARRKREEKKRTRVVRNSSMTIQQDDDGGDDRRERIETGLQPLAVKSDAGEDTEQAVSTTSAYAFPIYAYPSFQYVPFSSGFAIPCIAPVYRAETDGSNKTVANQTVSFRPFQGGKKSHAVNGVNALNEEGNAKAVSNGSVGCCSSAVSENRSISSQDGSSSDSASHRSRPRSSKAELHSSSGSDEPGASNGKAISNPSTISNAKKAHNAPPARMPQPTPSKVGNEDSTAVEPKPANVPITRSTSLPQPNTPVTKDNKVDNNSPGKPSKPQPVDKQKSSSLLSEMPCVSTTGNGPYGKTITGVLYRYSTTAEVSIVCVCHGESFSPAEFVKHAGDHLLFALNNKQRITVGHGNGFKNEDDGGCGGNGGTRGGYGRSGFSNSENNSKGNERRFYSPGGRSGYHRSDNNNDRNPSGLASYFCCSLTSTLGDFVISMGTRQQEPQQIITECTARDVRSCLSRPL